MRSCSEITRNVTHLISLILQSTDDGAQTPNIGSVPAPTVIHFQSKSQLGESVDIFVEVHTPHTVPLLV